jgi:hypothetical protein
VPDYDNHRLQKFSDNGTFIAIIGTSGGLDGEFDNPHSVDVDSEANDSFLFPELICSFTLN